MQLPPALTVRVPDLLRGACLAGLPSGALVPLTAFAGALLITVVARSVYDWRDPIPVGDARETGRHLLQWISVSGVTIALYFLLQISAGHFFVPAPDRLGRWLQAVMVGYGAALALRSLLRMQATMFHREAALTPSIAEVDRRAPVQAADALPPLARLEASVPETRLVTRSNWPGFLIGTLIVAVSLPGWDMNSLCLFRLPR